MFEPHGFHMGDFQPDVLLHGMDAAGYYESLAEISSVEIVCGYTAKARS